MEPRLATSVLVSGLIRRAEAEGGFGAVLTKGDATAGALLLILLERGQNPRLLERVLKPDGSYGWEVSAGQDPENTAEVPQLVDRRRRFDPDLWVVELDIPSAERFTAGMNPAG
jgi:hypothetical protein